MRHHGSGADHRTVADGHAAEHGHMTAQPYAVADHDRLGLARAVFALFEIKRMIGGEQTDHRRDPHIVAERNRRIVKHHAIEIDVGMRTDGDVAADLATKVRFDEHVFTNRFEQPFHDLTTTFDILVIGFVVFDEQSLRLGALAFDVRMRVLIYLAGHHQLPLVTTRFAHASRLVDLGHCASLHALVVSPILPERDAPYRQTCRQIVM